MIVKRKKKYHRQKKLITSKDRERFVVVTGRQTDRQTDRQIDRQTDRVRERGNVEEVKLKQAF